MKPIGLLRAVAAVSTLPILSQALTVGDVTRKSLSTFAKRSVLSDILNDIEHLAECTGCEVPKIGEPASAVDIR